MLIKWEQLAWTSCAFLIINEFLFLISLVPFLHVT